MPTSFKIEVTKIALCSKEVFYFNNSLFVDAFVNVEEDHLDYSRVNQNNLRTELYKEIHDVVSLGNSINANVGKIIIPPSFPWSIRYMINNYQDAMIIYRTYSNSNLFITFTCNLNWPEIQTELKKRRNYTHKDKIDIVPRLFRVKLNDMISYIKSGKSFRKTIIGKSSFYPFFLFFC